MAKVKNELISDLNVSWENYAGSSVESFIKDQLRKSCGYIYRSTSRRRLLLFVWLPVYR